MKTVNDVLDGVYSLLNDPGLGTGKTFSQFYKWSYPDEPNGDYFGVINTLEIPKNPVQDVEVNVNVYAKDLDLQRGIPDLKTLGIMMGSVIEDLHNYNNDCFDIEYKFMQVIREKDMQKHLFNLRFKLVFIANFDGKYKF